MKRVVRIAAAEIRWLLRQRLMLMASAITLLTLLASAAMSWDRTRHEREERRRLQTSQQNAFESSPDRHPHRMVHYGQFVFRPPSALSAFDPGINSFTGTSMFLEGHRQNSANFSEAGQSTQLMRFGEFSPAFVLQVLAPLLLLFLAAGAIGRERERRMLPLLLAHGVRPGQLLAGKWLAHATLSVAIMAPMAICLVGLSLPRGQELLTVAVIVLAYLAYLWLWSALAITMSVLMRQRRDALLALVGLWMLIAVILPRLLPAWALESEAMPSRFTTEIRLQRDLQQMGDSHNPEDPHYTAFKRDVLQRHGVTRVEDLPVNYAGLVAMEGERLTSELYRRYADEEQQVQARQNRWADAGSWLSPALALSRASAALSGSDSATHTAFLASAEAHRFAFVQRLNRMHAEEIPHMGDKERKVASSRWREVPRFDWSAPSADARTPLSIRFWQVLLLWSAVAVGALRFARRRLERET